MCNQFCAVITKMIKELLFVTLCLLAVSSLIDGAPRPQPSEGSAPEVELMETAETKVKGGGGGGKCCSGGGGHRSSGGHYRGGGGGGHYRGGGGGGGGGKGGGKLFKKG